MLRSWWLVICFAGIVGVLPAWAHDPGISTAEVQVLPAQIALVNGFAPDDAKQLLPPGLRNDERWDEDNFGEIRPSLLKLAGELWEVCDGETLLTATDIKVLLLPGDNVSFQFVYPRGQHGPKILLRARRLGDLPDGHRQFVIVSDDRGSTLTKKLLRAGDAALEVSSGIEPGQLTADGKQAPTVQPESPEFWEFFKLGVEHIWKGYDHLLFLFALLIVCHSFRSIVAIVSCFTLAHSITLAMATLGWVNFSPRIVEAMIAASIVYVGAENLWRRGAEPRGRWLLTFVFGLIHGFGFATVLRDLGVGRQGGSAIVMPLLSFNLGVEVGQIVVAALVLPLIWWLRKSEGFVRRGVPILSILIVVAGLWWLLERTVLA